MTEFEVKTHRVKSIRPHPNADRLELLELAGVTAQFVVQKGAYKPEEVVIYVPQDALIPFGLAAELGLPVKDGKPFRVKAIRLRGMWSEGVIVPFRYASLTGHEPVGTSVIEELGISKYEPPEAEFRSLPNQLIALPTGVNVYDIENAYRYPAAFARLWGHFIIVTEKLEGSNWWARMDRDGNLMVGQRRYAIRQNPDEPLHPHWKALYDGSFDKLLHALRYTHPGYDITLRGEIVGEGIQGNYYDLRGRHVYLFDIELNGTPLGARDFWHTVQYTGVKVAPLLFEGSPTLFAANLEDFIEKAHGNSKLNPAKLREGIVAKPIIEQYDPEIGRLFLKVRDREYLAQQG